MDSGREGQLYFRGASCSSLETCTNISGDIRTMHNGCACDKCIVKYSKADFVVWCSFATFLLPKQQSQLHLLVDIDQTCVEDTSASFPLSGPDRTGPLLAGLE